MTNKTPIQELIPAYRQWVKQLDLYDEYKNPLMTKPPNIDEFIAPYLEKEKQAITEAYCQGIHDTKGTSNWTDADKSDLYFESKYGK